MSHGLDDLATKLLAEMVRDNCRLAVKMLEIGDTASARRMLQSALGQLDQMESHSQKATKVTKQLTIEV